VTHLRVSRLGIRGLRSIDDVVLDLSGPTVLIGPNGSGKSTIIEACELMRKAGSEREFVSKLVESHGGADALLRKHAQKLELDIDLVDDDGLTYGYEIALRRAGSWLVVEREQGFVTATGQPTQMFLERRRGSYAVGPDDLRLPIKPIADDELALNAAAFSSTQLETVRAALASVEIHSAPDVRAAWLTPPGDLGLRASAIIRPITRLDPGNRSLANIYHALGDQSNWPDILARIQLALGDRIEAVTTPADPSGGRIGLAVRITGLGEIPAFAMSDGQLSYLALVGILLLRRSVTPSLVAFDEPELHLHPALIRRLTADLEVFGQQTSVLVATQSDALLDALETPARSAVLCDLDDRAATRCVRPDADELPQWLERYRGLGELRSAGYESLVFPSLEPQ